MENKTQTAVQWFVDQLPLRMKNYMGKEIEQALQMERGQSIECWNTAHQSGRFEGKGIAQENWQTFEQYYNETYGK